MRGVSALFSCLVILQLLCLLIQAQPTLLLSPRTNEYLVDSRMSSMPSKRAFDRVDMSPFDFGAFSKRYNDDLQRLSRRKKSFDRLDQGPFGLVKRKRVFDRVDAGFGFGKRSAQVPRELNDRTSIAELVRQADLIEPIGMV